MSAKTEINIIFQPTSKMGEVFQFYCMFLKMFVPQLKKKKFKCIPGGVITFWKIKIKISWFWFCFFFGSKIGSVVLK